MILQELVITNHSDTKHITYHSPIHIIQEHVLNTLFRGTQHIILHTPKEATFMSVVIIGGHDRMVSQYKKICKNYNCKAKVFTQMSASLDKQIGRPDLLVLFTNTVSHKMIRCALDEVNEQETEIVRCHTSSGTALTEILMQHVPA